MTPGEKITHSVTRINRIDIREGYVHVHYSHKLLNSDNYSGAYWRWCGLLVYIVVSLYPYTRNAVLQFYNMNIYRENDCIPGFACTDDTSNVPSHIT